MAASRSHNARASKIFANSRLVTKVIALQVDRRVRREFKKIKADLIKEFLRHPVTLELLGGAGADHISGTFGEPIQGQNLFTFIGFPIGTKPIAPILRILESIDVESAIRSKQIRRDGKIVYKVQNFPVSNTIFDPKVTPMPWADGRSWAKGIESGISGLGFLARAKGGQSRSGKAFQRPKRIRAGKFQNTQYISALLNKYKNKFKITL